MDNTVIGLLVVTAILLVGAARQQEMMAFKSFYTTKLGGLCIGLIMVKQIMERFGGEVSLSSQEQTGTSVCLCFKVAS
ncbi:MAG: ATP-binding protein [Pseudomonas sp.]